MQETTGFITRPARQTLLAGALVFAAIVLCWVPQVDDATETYLANSLSDNLVIYGSARIINSLISVSRLANPM